MAHSIVGEEAFLEAAAALFLEYGFAGTSVSQIAAATGLEKASLYYRYPGGKDAIAIAVAGRIAGWLVENVVKPLEAEGAPEDQVRQVVRHLRTLYGDGTTWCGLEMLSLKGASEEMSAGLRAALTAWLGAFATVARRSGASAAEARHRAEAAVAQIEGALVLSRVLRTPRPFQRVMEGLVEMLTAGYSSAALTSRTRLRR